METLVTHINFNHKWLIRLILLIICIIFFLVGSVRTVKKHQQEKKKKKIARKESSKRWRKRGENRKRPCALNSLCVLWLKPAVYFEVINISTVIMTRAHIFYAIVFFHILLCRHRCRCRHRRWFAYLMRAIYTFLSAESIFICKSEHLFHIQSFWFVSSSFVWMNMCTKMFLFLLYCYR